MRGSKKLVSILYGLPMFDDELDRRLNAGETVPGLFLRIAQIVIVCLGVWMILTTSAVLVLALLSGKPVFRAVICMGSGLVLF